MRVEAREALPKLARWLEERLGVTFLWGTPVLGIEGESVRHAGGCLQAGAARLREVLNHECRDALAAGVHLIVAQGADGSLVVGDSHHDADFADPFSSGAVDELILGELHALFDLPAINVVERWVGHYPVANVKPLLRESLAPRVRLACVTGGTGMSTAFAIGEETIEELF